MYESTMDALTALYPKLSRGGDAIVDDYAIAACRRAVDEYRHALDIKDPIGQIDWTRVFLKKSRAPG
jgi:O-methyltransferase